MSLLPLIVSLTDDHGHYDPWSDITSSWGLPILHPHLHNHQPRRTTPGGYQRNWNLATAPRRTCGQQRAKDHTGKDGFQVCVDVQQFAPNEISVKTVDNSILVEGKHEEKSDEEGFVSRHFVRRYVLPKGYDPQQVVSTLSSDGILTVKAPPPAPSAIEGRERVVQIQQTGPAHLSVKANEQGEQKKEEGENVGEHKTK